MPSTFPSRYSFSIVSGMSLRSQQSRLEYWLLVHVCRSSFATFSLSLLFTSLVIDKSDLSCSKVRFWYLPAKCQTYSNNPEQDLSADQESAIIINETNFSYLLQPISVFYLQRHPHATAANLESRIDTSEVCKIQQFSSRQQSSKNQEYWRA